MSRHVFSPLRGRLDELTVESKALAGNLLGDPASRRTAVYLPEGHDDGGGDYPLIVYLSGYGGSGLGQTAWKGFGESLPQRVERLIAEERMAPAIVAMPDAFTSLGGNQYINSPVFGNWEDYLLEELLPALGRSYRVRPGAAHRAVLGKSSGGYGSLIQGMKHGEHWGAIASHSGDVDFDLVYRSDFPKIATALARHGGDIAGFVNYFTEARKTSWPEMHVLSILAMAATYDPDVDAPLGVRLPFDAETCRLDPERWEQWLSHDPLRLADRPECREKLSGLKGLFIDCGSRDQFHLHFGTRALVRKLRAASIEHRYEEFDDDHLGTSYRLDVSLPFLSTAIRS